MAEPLSRTPSTVTMTIIILCILSSLYLLYIRRQNRQVHDQVPPQPQSNPPSPSRLPPCPPPSPDQLQDQQDRPYRTSSRRAPQQARSINDHDCTAEPSALEQHPNSLSAVERSANSMTTPACSSNTKLQIPTIAFSAAIAAKTARMPRDGWNCGVRDRRRDASTQDGFGGLMAALDEKEGATEDNECSQMIDFMRMWADAAGHGRVK